MIKTGTHRFRKPSYEFHSQKEGLKPWKVGFVGLPATETIVDQLFLGIVNLGIFSNHYQELDMGSTMWGPLVISWFLTPSNYGYNYHKP